MFVILDNKYKVMLYSKKIFILINLLYILTFNSKNDTYFGFRSKIYHFLNIMSNFIEFNQANN